MTDTLRKGPFRKFPGEENLDDQDVTGWDRARHHAPIPDPPSKPRPCLIVIGGDLTGHLFELKPTEEVVIGRSPEASIRVREWGVSRIHAKIRPVGNGLELVDLNSANGTFVNQYRVVGPTPL